MVLSLILFHATRIPIRKIPTPKYNINALTEIKVVNLPMSNTGVTIAAFTKMSLQAKVLPLNSSGTIFWISALIGARNAPPAMPIKKMIPEAAIYDCTRAKAIIPNAIIQILPV